jgi:putative lipoprotein
MRMSWLKVMLGLVLGLLALPMGQAAAATLSGEVTYRERIALPPGASLKVRLIDMTAPGAPTRVEAEAAIASPGQVPLSFSLNFDDRVIDAAHSYALVAEISVGLELWFRNAEPFDVAPLAPEAPVSIVASFVGRLQTIDPSGTGGETATQSDGSIVNVTWRAIEVRGEPAIVNSEPTLSIAEDLRAGGRGGCNNYFAQTDVAGESIRFSAVGSTRMACLSDAASAQEAAFFEVLAAARFWRVTGDEMVLMGASGAELARFQRAVR